MSERGVFQVVFLDVMRPDLERWLDQRGAHLFKIPQDDDDELPVYGIGIKDWTDG